MDRVSGTEDIPTHGRGNIRPSPYVDHGVFNSQSMTEAFEGYLQWRTRGPSARTDASQHRLGSFVRLCKVFDAVCIDYRRFRLKSDVVVNNTTLVFLEVNIDSQFCKGINMRNLGVRHVRYREVIRLKQQSPSSQSSGCYFWKIFPAEDSLKGLVIGQDSEAASQE